MTKSSLTTVVVGYDDTETALADFQDLERAHKENRLPSYDAAVVERTADSKHGIVATTINPRRTDMLRGAGLGLAVGVISPLRSLWRPPGSRSAESWEALSMTSLRSSTPTWSR